MTIFNVILVFALIFGLGYSMVTKLPDDANHNEEDLNNGEEE